MVRDLSTVFREKDLNPAEHTMNRLRIHRYLVYALLYALGIALFSIGAGDLAHEDGQGSPSGGRTLVTVLNSIDMSG
ncbi:hypothetical protein [Streptomyces sp. NPDC057253]|uniref:hypothetical protein n=1 Tax=Streptomyces sp. NPDC057253 TaxID=3346069 RepID=UPI003642A28A